MILKMFLLCVFPVTLTEVLSQFEQLTTSTECFFWINELSSWLIMILQKIFSAVVVNLLIIFLSMLLNFFIIKQSILTNINAELIMQNYYFRFLFIQIFLVICISSNLTAIFSNYKEGLGSIASLLMLELLKSSHYFLSYILLQSSSVNAAVIVQIEHLFQYFFELMWNKSLKKVWRRQCNRFIHWDIFFSVYINLMMIRLIYSVVFSFILILNVFTFIIFLLMQRFNIINLSTFNINIRGQLYLKALNQLFVSLYFIKICTCDLFSFTCDEDSQSTCVTQVVLILLLFVKTVVF